MIILPYSTALTLARPPTATYIVTLVCCLIFYLQMVFPITENLLYYPDSWNPLKMISSSLIHGDLLHLLGNMIFFLAFAPALELLIGSNIRYLWIMVFISFVVGICYSVSILIGGSQPVPTLGFSGVVMGMMGLAAYMMPQARIRVFWWYIVFWKTFYVPAWVLAVIYIGLDTWTMLTTDYYGGINVVAHVAGGFAGYLYGYLWLKERKEDTSEELADEIEEMKIEQQFGRSRSNSFRGRKQLDQINSERQALKADDKFMGSIYRMVISHRDSEAIVTLMEKYDCSVHDYESIYQRINEWGPSRTLLCMGRLIIDRLDQDGRHGRVLFYIENCQKISPQFVLPDVSKTIFYADFAIQADRPEVAINLLTNADKRYGNMVDRNICAQLMTTLNMA